MPLTLNTVGGMHRGGPFSHDLFGCHWFKAELSSGGNLVNVDQIRIN